MHTSAQLGQPKTSSLSIQWRESRDWERERAGPPEGGGAMCIMIQSLNLDKNKYLMVCPSLTPVTAPAGEVNETQQPLRFLLAAAI